MKYVAALCLLGLMSVALPVSAQRMDVKRHLGFDFTNKVDDILRYYRGLGVLVDRDEQQQKSDETIEKPAMVRFVSFRNTPRFLSVTTSFIHLGILNGRIEVISIATDDLFGSEQMDSKLHAFSRGNVSVRETGGPKEIEWGFDDCRIVKSIVSKREDAKRYMKYDIIPIKQLL